MPRPYAHLANQGPVLATLARTALGALKQRAGFGPTSPPDVPGPTFHAHAAPLPHTLIRDYVRHVGGNPYAYLDTVPPHLWPQWGFPWAARTLDPVPYPLLRVLNGGCRLTLNGPLPQHQTLRIRAHLAAIDDNGHRAVLHQVIETGTVDRPDLITADLYAIVPLRKRSHAEGAPKAPETVPIDARQLERWVLRSDAGLEFALLTGDFNPVHWVRPYARLFGFKSTILHGFASMARAMESINKHVFNSDVTRLHTFDVKFTKPIVLPGDVGVFLSGQQVFVGKAPGEPACLVGTFAPTLSP